MDKKECPMKLKKANAVNVWVVRVAHVNHKAIIDLQQSFWFFVVTKNSILLSK
ncbi:MAG: hypothetical protein K9L17_07770 [Clostridiales bacterium]|nr:hypothetical protein [Clostridiales bacterium]